MQPSEIIDPPHTRANLKMLETSIRKEFPIDEKILEALPKVMMSLVASDKATKREKISAARVIVAMQNSNQPVVQAHIHKHVQEVQQAPPPEPEQTLSQSNNDPQLLMNYESETLRELLELNATAQSVEELLHIGELIETHQSADRQTVKQKATLEQMTQSAAAWMVGIGPRTLRGLHTPRNKDGSYNAPDMLQWAIDRQMVDAKARWERESSDIQSAAVRQAEARAIKLEEQAKALQDRYIDKEDIERDLALLFGRLESRLSSLGGECAAIAPGELKATIKQLIDERVRLALKELSDGSGSL